MKKYSFKGKEKSKKVRRILNKIKTFNLNHKNLIILIVSIFVAYKIISSEFIPSVLTNLGSFGYLGSFFVGILFSYGFSTAPAAATIFLLAKSINPFLLAAIAAFGGMVGDLIIFKFVREHLVEEIKFIISEELHLKIPFTSRIMRSAALKKIIPAIAGIFMTLPLPGEIAMILFGSVKYELKKVALLSYIFNFIGILCIILLGILI